jgi:CRP/FNR family transcriptional regulator
MTVAELEEIDDNKDEINFKKGSILFNEGDSADRFFCIRSGTIRVYRESQSLSGREQTFSLRNPGDWVGCRDVILGDVYNHTAICVGDVFACIIPKSLLETLGSDLHFQQELLKQIATNWKESENQVFSLGTKQIHSKLAEFLLAFYKSNSEKSEITLCITREVIASIIGTTTESVIRALSDFKAREWIDIDKNKIIFKNLESLSGIAEIDRKSISY